MKKILFVCTGNICRSTTAEAIARNKIKALGLENDFLFDSAGTTGFHVGESADSRSIEVGRKNGVSFDGIFSRKIDEKDFQKFDLIMAMDQSHETHLKEICSSGFREKIKLFLRFCEVENSWNDNVIDPYYQEMGSFEKVFATIDIAISRLLQKLS